MRTERLGEQGEGQAALAGGRQKAIDGQIQSYECSIS